MLRVCCDCLGGELRESIGCVSLAGVIVLAAVCCCLFTWLCVVFHLVLYCRLFLVDCCLLMLIALVSAVLCCVVIILALSLTCC